jgi:hypothetical protein
MRKQVMYPCSGRAFQEKEMLVQISWTENTETKLFRIAGGENNISVSGSM